MVHRRLGKEQQPRFTSKNIQDTLFIPGAPGTGMQPWDSSHGSFGSPPQLGEDPSPARFCPCLFLRGVWNPAPDRHA